MKKFNWKKQIWDQFWHLGMGVISVNGFAWLFKASPHNLIYAVLLTVFWVALREWTQWPSSRWWDPPLDFLFEALGILLGMWVYYHFSI